MKLLTKTSGAYILVSVTVFIIAGFIFFHLLHKIFYNQIDERLIEEKMLIEQTISESDTVPDFHSVFGHLINITLLKSPKKKFESITDTLMYDREQGQFGQFRHLFVQNKSLLNQGYTINIYKSLRESENLIAEILISVTLVFITLLFLLVLVNYFIARRVWIPFYRILSNLNQYDINQEQPLELTKTDIHEFILLNKALEKMSRKIRQDFLNLKEFNEIAAHELQTPLAIIKLKLELLIQNENLSEHQLQLISSVFEATTRMSKLNQGLLLISKIENNQFYQTEAIDLVQILDKTLLHFEEMIDHREITLTKDYSDKPTLVMNRMLAEILITNLLSNAIRHNIHRGHIDIIVQSGALTISNTGQILKTDPRNLFERFRKSEHHSDSVGLGLSIVQKIVNLYHMEVEYFHGNSVHTLKISF